MKARDIIPGWPRGRTTSGGPLHVWQDSSYWPRRYGSDEMIEAWMLEGFYHRGQQEMVNAHFEQWRIGTAVRRDEMQEYFDALARRFTLFGIY